MGRFRQHFRLGLVYLQALLLFRVLRRNGFAPVRAPPRRGREADPQHALRRVDGAFDDEVCSCLDPGSA